MAWTASCQLCLDCPASARVCAPGSPEFPIAPPDANQFPSSSHNQCCIVIAIFPCADLDQRQIHRHSVRRTTPADVGVPVSDQHVVGTVRRRSPVNARGQAATIVVVGR